MSAASQDILIGIDLGTTVLKAIAVAAEDGALLAQASQRLPLTVLPDGTREQVPAAVDAALTQVLGALRAALGARWQAVTGVGLSAQGGSTIIVDRETGEPHTEMILWNDARAFPDLRQLMEEHDADYWRDFSLRDEPGVGLARLRWLRRTNPALLNERNLYVGAGEYLYHRLTGCWAQDACNALQIGCYDARRQCLTLEPLSLIDIPLDFVAPMRQGHATSPLTRPAAMAYGLPHGIPVVGPYNDHEAGYLAAQGVSARPLQYSLGTAWVGNFVMAQVTDDQSPFQFVVPSPVGDGYQIILPLLTGNVTWDWALSALLGGGHEQALRTAAHLFDVQVSPPSALVFLPWLNRPHPLLMDQHGAGAFVGLSPTVDIPAMLRAVVAGMCCEGARVFRPIVEGGMVDSLVLSGGASKGWYFQQWLAALLKLPTFQVIEEEWMSARGCLYALQPAAARAAVRPVEPRPDVDPAAVRQAAQEYLTIFDQLYGHIPVGRPFTVADRRC